MQIINCEQNSPEWFAARAGIATASEFDKILTPTGKESAQADKYINKLLADIVAGEPVNDFEGSAYMERGKELEAEAVSWYEFYTGNATESVGFVLSDGYGCSPDRLVGEDGLLEIKCPAGHTHVEYMLSGFDKGYYPQVQGQLLVTGRRWCDWVSYHPKMQPIIKRITRDKEYISKLKIALAGFNKKLADKRAVLVAAGFIDA